MGFDRDLEKKRRGVKTRKKRTISMYLYKDNLLFVKVGKI